MIKDPPLLTIRREFPRPDQALTAMLADIPTGYLVDCQNGRGALDYRIKPLADAAARKTFVGVALTCRPGPDDNLALFAAVAVARPGDILVAATDEYTGAALTGDLLLGMAKNQGVAALVTDGLVRDVTGLLEVGLPVFCRGVSPNSPARNGPGTVGLPVTLGGVTVTSGDIIVGDCDGVVVVPQALFAELPERLKEVRAAEAALEAEVRGGLAVPDFIQGLLDSERVRYL